MKAKHLNIPEDTALYNSIFREINDKIVLDKKKADRYFLFKFLFYGSLSIGSYAMLFIIINPFLFVLDFVFFGLEGSVHPGTPGCGDLSSPVYHAAWQ